MMLLFWLILVLCLPDNTETIIDMVQRKVGESVTIECSFKKCRNRFETNGMYLHHEVNERREVFYYYQKLDHSKTSVRRRYAGRVLINGTLKDHKITISNLTVDDSGLYKCNYSVNAQCDILALWVSEPTNNSSGKIKFIPIQEKCPSQVLIIVATCAISVAASMILCAFVRRVKHWTSSRKNPRHPQATDYVYEVMTKDGLRPIGK